MGEMILILGGARSGKSRLAERLAAEVEPVTYVATATFDDSDPEMATRIDRHRASRPEGWETLEVPRDVEGVLAGKATRGGTVLIDCVTLWLTNLMLGLGGGPGLDDREILEVVERAGGADRGDSRVIWVSNEVGSGVVPENALARRFADLQGRANQALAARSDVVHLCVAGLSIRLK
jgi:adenosylcobinamide kinase / adenosylcobinamide-phosphate guanylyltransferase